MSDRHEPTPLAAAAEADPVGRLVRLAGARPPVPAERTVRVEARVRDAWQAGVESRRRGRWLGWSAGLAAAAVLAVLIGVGWRYAMRPAAPPMVVAVVERVAGTLGSGVQDPEPLAAGSRVLLGAVLATADEGRAALRLPIAGGGGRGPSLRLDVDTRLRFVAPYRLRLERGAIYVDSQGGPRVVVETPWGEVEERGTQFEVRVGGGGVRVRVREGAIELAAPAVTGEGARAWQAVAGAELTLATDGRLSRATIPSHGAAWSWVQEIAPSFQLEGSTLGEFLAWVERESGLRVAWADPMRAESGGRAVMHGSIEGMPPEQALAAVLPTCGLADRRDGESVVVFASSR